MSTKRPAVDLSSITDQVAKPLPEATQRTANAAVQPCSRSADTEQLAFKVPADFRKRFRLRALESNLKLNQLLFACLDAWETQNMKK